MSLWTDFLGAEIRYIETPSFGRTRIAEAGRGKSEALFLMHGIGGHLEAYAKNVVPLAEKFHVIAFDMCGHGYSEKKTDIEYLPDVYAEHLRELMDALDIEKAHISGESLGGMVTGSFVVKYPERTLRAVLNTTGGIPIVSEKGMQDLRNLADLSKRNFGKAPTTDSVRARMQWLIYEGNWPLLTEELIETRLRIYQQPDFQKAAPLVFKMLNPAASGNGEPPMIELEKISSETLFLWTRFNPIHDLEAAEAACPRVPGAQLYVMKEDAAHWPQYEAPQEFNRVMEKFISTGKVG